MMVVEDHHYSVAQKMCTAYIQGILFRLHIRPDVTEKELTDHGSRRSTDTVLLSASRLAANHLIILRIHMENGWIFKI